MAGERGNNEGCIYMKKPDRIGSMVVFRYIKNIITDEAFFDSKWKDLFQAKEPTKPGRRTESRKRQAVIN